MNRRTFFRSLFASAVCATAPRILRVAFVESIA